MLHLYCFLKSVAARRPWTSEDGVTALEYGLIAALIAVVIIGAVTTLGTNLNSVFGNVRDNLVVK